MRLIVDIPEDIVDTFNGEEPLLLSMQQEAYLIEAAYEACQQAVEEINEDAISRRDMALNIVSFYDKATGKKKTLDFLCKCVDSLPSMQPQQKTGHWIKTISENGVTSAVRCSECGFEDNRYMLFRYCPNCGAKMKEGD